MGRKFVLCCVLFIFLGLFCSDGKKEDPAMPVWIIGTWQSVLTDKPFYESWEIKNDSIWSGLSWYFADQDTVVVEVLTLLKRNQDLYYMADVPQNDQAVYFKAMEISQHKYIFENPSHDFPQRIIYFTPQNDTLRARIEGGSKAVDFVFVRYSHHE